MKRNLLTTLIATVIVTTGSLNISTRAFASTDTHVTSAIEIQNAILENMRNRETNFTIHYQGADTTVVSQLNNIIDTVTGTSIDEYLNLSFTNFNPQLSGTNTDFEMVVTATYLTTKEQEQFVDDKVAQIMSTIVTPDMNEKQKIQAIHKYILDHVEYDTTLNERTAYTALYDGKTVCMGYAMLLQKMAQKVGIECHIIKGGSNAGYHAWNKVKVDGAWYNIDATTDDSLGSPYNEVVFMVTDQFLSDNKYSPDSDSPSLPVANTEYVRDTGTDDPLTIATNAVTKAESTALQADVDSAQTLVTALPDGVDKTALQNKLDFIKANLDTAYQTQVTNAVAKAESSKSQEDVDTAKFLVNALVDGTDKTGLLDRLVTVQNIINNQALSIATNEVVIAEGSKLQNDVDGAKFLVDALVSGTAKTNLLNRLSAVQTAINTANSQALTIATNEVVIAESSKSQNDVDGAKYLVDALPNGTAKTDLLSRLNVVQTAIDTANNQALTIATNAVVKAEGSKLQADVDSAIVLVDALSNETAKTDLLSRLVVVQTAIDTANTNNATNQAITNATNAVATAEGSKLQADIDSAKSLVNALANGTTKTALLSRLDVVQTAIDTANATNATNQAITNATNAVATAEGSKLQADVDNAKTLVNALPSGTVKTDLQGRLNVVQTAIDTANANATNTANQQALTNATNAVAKAESSKLQVDVNSAKALVNALSNGTDKTALLSRLTTVQTTIDENNNQIKPVVIKITGIVINGDNNITSKNGTVQLGASVTPNNASDSSITWTSNDESIATVSTSGIVLAKGNGTVIIKATAKDGSGIVGTKTITITGQTTATTTATTITTTTTTNSVLKSVSISGTEEVGRTLKSKISYDGTEPSVKYQWQRATTKNGSYSDINGATDDTYKLKSSDKNKYVKLVVTTTINGQTYDVEDITSKIDTASSSDSVSTSDNSSSTPSSDVSTGNNNDTVILRPSNFNNSPQDNMGPIMPTNESPGNTNIVSTSNVGTSSASLTYGRFTNPAGHPVSGWISSNGNWYYLDSNGVAKTGWVNVNSRWYYLNPNADANRATMKTGWVQDNGKWYYLNSSGAMVSNTTIDGYKIGSDGALI